MEESFSQGKTSGTPVALKVAADRSELRKINLLQTFLE